MRSDYIVSTIVATQTHYKVRYKLINLLEVPFSKNATKVNLVASYILPTMKNGKFEAIRRYY